MKSILWTILAIFFGYLFFMKGIPLLYTYFPEYGYAISIIGMPKLWYGFAVGAGAVLVVEFLMLFFPKRQNEEEVKVKKSWVIGYYLLTSFFIFLLFLWIIFELIPNLSDTKWTSNVLNFLLPVLCLIFIYSFYPSKRWIGGTNLFKSKKTDEIGSEPKFKSPPTISSSDLRKNSDIEKQPAAKSIMPIMPKIIDNEKKSESIHLSSKSLTSTFDDANSTEQAVLDSFPKASVSIEYRNDVGEAWSRIQNLPSELVLEFLTAIDSDPKQSVLSLEESIMAKHRQSLSPFDQEELTSHYLELKSISEEAAEEFVKVESLLGDTLSAEEIAKKIKKKFT